jgi:acylphosphatase
MEQLKRVRLLAAGNVQGVFFRDSLRKEAERLHITGWARNRPDGRVEAELQGPALAVDEAVDICRQGPGHSRVSQLDVDEIGFVDGEERFEIR